MDARQQARVDEVTRAVLYPWVRDSISLLAVLRDDLMRDLTERAGMIAPSSRPDMRAMNELVKQRLRDRIAKIDRIIEQATAG